MSRTGGSELLRWPVEDRFVAFVEQVRTLLEESQPMQTLSWWPSGHDFAVVLTHDVEGCFGLDHLMDVLSVEREAGFRSCVGFVGDAYEVPGSLLQELRTEGFEIALHGWRHDGRDFSSGTLFNQRLLSMNQRLREWDAVGFRSPMTHRNPVWMQGLDVRWDSSFFDTDPYEPLPGGVMSIWPFVMGRFVELPYTLPQDHTLIETLGETSPRLWLEKLDFLAAHQGMALVNVHPDYLCRNGRLRMYEEFLQEVARRSGYWHALPRDVASWTLERWRGDQSDWSGPAGELVPSQLAAPAGSAGGAWAGAPVPGENEVGDSTDRWPSRASARWRAVVAPQGRDVRAAKPPTHRR